MTIEPISDERLAALREALKDADENPVYDVSGPTFLALLSRLDKAEAGWQKPEPPSDVRDGFPSKIEWIRAYRAKHNAPLKYAKEAYENGTPLDGAPATFEVHQDGMCVAAASGPRDHAYSNAMHYAAVYGQDGPVEVFELVPVPLPPPPSAGA